VWLSKNMKRNGKQTLGPPKLNSKNIKEKEKFGGAGPMGD